MPTQEFDNKVLEQVCNWLGNYTGSPFNKKIKEFFLKLDRDFCENHFTCPNCHGFGKIENKHIKNTLDPLEEEIVCDEIECEVCKGKGWTNTKLKPITETKIVGWK